MNDDLKELFGSDSDESDNEQAPATSAVAPQQKQFDVDELFGSSDDNSDEPSAKAPASRLKKVKPAKKAAPKNKDASSKRSQKSPKSSKGSDDARAKKRPRPEKGGSDRNSDGATATGDGGAADGQDAYDSGEEVVATAADDAFIDSDDDLGDLKAEYDAEKQSFRDERANGFESDDDDEDSGKYKKKGNSGSSEVISKNSTNMVDKAILASRKQRSSEMSDMDKQAVVSALVEKMDDAWRQDCASLTANPPQPALAKLAMLDSVEKVMSQRSLHDTLLDMNALEVVRNWLAPFPAEDLSTGRELPLAKRTLPNLTLRGKLYALLKAMPIMPEHLKNSERGGDDARPGLGKVSLMLLKHPGETADHKRVLQSLLEDWSRRIFKRTHNYKQLSHHIRESDHAGSSSSSSSSAARRRAPPVGTSEPGGDFLADGDKDAGASEAARTRVQLPIRVGFDFKVRPAAPKVEAAKKGKQMEKKQQLAVKMKEQHKQVATGSQRGVAPLKRVDY